MTLFLLLDLLIFMQSVQIIQSHCMVLRIRRFSQEIVNNFGIFSEEPCVIDELIVFDLAIVHRLLCICKQLKLRLQELPHCYLLLQEPLFNGRPLTLPCLPGLKLVSPFLISNFGQLGVEDLAQT